MFEFDHDVSSSPKGAGDLVAYVHGLQEPDSQALTGITSHMRFIDKSNGAQWGILEMSDTWGRQVRTSA